MTAIYFKELIIFFSSAAAYVALTVFLLVMGLVMWIFPGNTFDYGHASAEIFFEQAPLVLLFFIPATTMRMLSDEVRTGTLEILMTRPLSEWQLIMGKFWAAVTIVFLALALTTIYIYTLAQLSTPPGNIDYGAIIGSYAGLLFLGGCFVATGLFASAWTDNAIVAYLLGAFLCFVLYAGLGATGTLVASSGWVSDALTRLGIQYHYGSMARGVMDSRDLLYFASLTLLLLWATHLVALRRKTTSH